MTDKPYTNNHWQSPEGLALHFRDYAGDGTAKTPVVCLHGLTRNARDFESLAPHIARQSGRRVLVPEMRGRGKSAYSADPASYAVPTYVGDVLALLEQEKVDRFVAIGTSMGGLITMGIAAMQPDRIAGFVLNDIGPVVEAEGIARIRDYIGQGGSFPTWVHAARSLAEVHGATYPDYDLAAWLVLAKRTMIVTGNGRIAFDYDMKIAEPILAEAGASAAAVPPDLWPMVRALEGKPALLVRGELSVILAESTLAEMAAALPGSRTLTVARTGHAPTLDEPEARAAIDALLAGIA